MALTYEPIATTTLGANASSITFSSIPSTYTDLKLVLVGYNASGGASVRLQFNGDTGTNYSQTSIYGDGSEVTSFNTTSVTGATIATYWLSSGYYYFSTANIFSYAGSTYKTCLGIGSGADTRADASASLWRSTSAINSIKIIFSSANNFATGTTATLYGIKAA